VHLEEEVVVVVVVVVVVTVVTVAVAVEAVQTMGTIIIMTKMKMINMSGPWMKMRRWARRPIMRMIMAMRDTGTIMVIIMTIMMRGRRRRRMMMNLWKTHLVLQIPYSVVDNSVEELVDRLLGQVID
jgi:hypothetical protein